MPVWAWIVVTLAAGLGSGLLGTLVTIRYERGAELRKRALEISEYAGEHAEDWLDAVEKAIVGRLQGMYLADDYESDRFVEAAATAVREARGVTHGLHITFPPGSTAPGKFAYFVGCSSMPSLALSGGLPFSRRTITTTKTYQSMVTRRSRQWRSVRRSSRRS